MNHEAAVRGMVRGTSQPDTCELQAWHPCHWLRPLSANVQQHLAFCHSNSSHSSPILTRTFGNRTSVTARSSRASHPRKSLRSSRNSQSTADLDRGARAWIVNVRCVCSATSVTKGAALRAFGCSITTVAIGWWQPATRNGVRH